MNNTNIIEKIIASIGGAYAGTLLATGITVILGGELKTGVWWDWIAYAFMWGTIISIPISILLMFSLVRIVFKKLVNNNEHNYKKYALVGIVAGASPILLIYIITLIYFLITNASPKEFGSTLLPFSYFLLNGVLCGALGLIILCKISYNKSLNLTGAENAPPS